MSPSILRIRCPTEYFYLTPPFLPPGSAMRGRLMCTGSAIAWGSLPSHQSLREGLLETITRRLNGPGLLNKFLDWVIQ